MIESQEMLVCGDCGGPLDVKEEGQTLSVRCKQCRHGVSQTLQAAVQTSYEDRIAELAHAYDMSRPSIMAPKYLEEYQAGSSHLKKEDVQRMKDEGALPSPAWQPLFDAMGIA